MRKLICFAIVMSAIFASPVLVAGEAQGGSSFAPIHFSTGSGTISRDITISSDSIVGVTDDGGVISTTRMDFIGNKLIVTTVTDLSTASATYDLEKANKFIQENPQIVQQFQEGTRVVSTLERHLQTNRFGAAPAAAGSCIAEANAMMDAADRAIVACAGGGGLGCSIATAVYGRARDAYTNCVKAMSAGSQ
ncbi:MAG: hypothetical protein ACREPN_05650 [Rudaea sp.]